MNNLTLRQFRYFDALARHRHFGRAAAACAITQPALSVQIREMEAALGTPLFDRTTRQVTLTGFGAEVAGRIGDILRSVEELDDLARLARGRLVGRFRLGVIPTVAPYLLPALIGRLTELHDGLDIRVRESLTRTLIAELTAGDLDAAIVALPVSEPQLVEMPLIEEEFVLVRPLAEAALPVPDAQMLRQMKLLLLEEGHCFRDQALAFCETGAAGARELLDASSLSTLVQLVGAGIGVTLIPRMAVPVETGSAQVAIARFAPPRPSRTIGMIWRRSTPLDAQLREIAEEVRAIGAGL
ncbi:MAG: LysR substrate-binding domain-containing protein [Tropicimonas sp.]|uniref:hydrogen peroxide-inducible genes activator n=1 Tax=Tropicimonas sp. TaxID=2067044 RepID=UPI003A8A2BFE